ncbi:MAG: hypothetical protein JXA71_15680 [Chitinispirillaceae bacterium]|nr:hypothetical protein [Chitinispirillaceae bacterium]
MKTFLLSYKQDFDVAHQEERARFLEKSYPGIPFIDDLELRLQNEAYDINRLRYTVRLKPRGMGETMAARRYNKTVARTSQQRLQVRSNNALMDRYEKVIDLLEHGALAAYYKELGLLCEDRIKVLEKKTYTGDAGLDELIDAENDNTKVHTRLFDEQKAITLIKRSIKMSMSADKGFDGFDTTGLVPVDSIIARVENGRFVLDTNNAHLDYFRLRLKLAEERYTLEKAERRRYLDFIGFSYDNGEMLDEMERRNEERSYNLNNAYRLEMCIAIPDLTRARHDIARRKIDYLSEKEDYEELKQEMSEKMNKDLEDLRSLIAQYRFLKARESEVDATSSLKKYLQMSAVDPLVLLSIKESIVKNHLDMAALKFSIMRNYIYVIDAAGLLSQQPLRNFLSAGTEVIEK